MSQGTVFGACRESSLWNSEASVGKGNLNSSYLMICLKCFAEGYGEEGSRFTISVSLNLEEILTSFRSLRQMGFLLTQIQQNILWQMGCLDVLNPSFNVP